MTTAFISLETNPEEVKIDVDLSTERLKELAAEQDLEAQSDLEILPGFHRMSYFQKRAEASAQYAAAGYKLPPNHHTQLTYLTHCTHKAIHGLRFIK